MSGPSPDKSNTELGQPSGQLSDHQKKEIQDLVNKTLDLDLKQTLDRPSEDSRLKIIRQWHLWQPKHIAKIVDSNWDFYAAIKKSLYDHDVQQKNNAFSASKDLACFEILPDLIRVVVQPNYLHKENASAALIFLSSLWFHLSTKSPEPADSQLRKILDRVSSKPIHNIWPSNRAHLRKLLQDAGENYENHEQPAVLTAFFLILDYTDVILKRSIQNDAMSIHNPLMKLLSDTHHPTVLTKLSGFVGTRSPANSMVDLWKHRSDEEFIRYFLAQIELSVPSVVNTNLRRMGTPGWLFQWIEDFGELNIENQSAVLKVAKITFTDQNQLLETILKMLTAAKLPVQRQLVSVLCSIPGIKSTQVIEYLLSQQSDPGILQVLIPQIRKRNLQGAMKKLLSFLDHHDEGVRQAAGEAFGDCTITRYLQAFDMLNEKVRVSTGQLVSKVDPNVCRVLLEELTSPHKTVVLKALVALRYIHRRDELESTVCDLLKSYDPKIRQAAAETLGYYHTENAMQVLRRCLADPDLHVQKAAERSLQFMTGN